MQSGHTDCYSDSHKRPTLARTTPSAVHTTPIKRYDQYQNCWHTKKRNKRKKQKKSERHSNFSKVAVPPNGFVSNHLIITKTSATKSNGSNFYMPSHQNLIIRTGQQSEVRKITAVNWNNHHVKSDLSYAEIVTGVRRVKMEPNKIRKTIVEEFEKPAQESKNQTCKEEKQTNDIISTFDASTRVNPSNLFVGQTTEDKCEHRDIVNTRKVINNSSITSHLDEESQNLNLIQSTCIIKKSSMTLEDFGNIQQNEAKTKANAPEHHEGASHLENCLVLNEKINIPGIEKKNEEFKITSCIVAESLPPLNFESFEYQYVSKKLHVRHYESEHMYQYLRNMSLCLKKPKKLDNGWSNNFQDLLNHFSEYSILCRITPRFTETLLDHKDVMVYVVLTHLPKSPNHELSVSDIPHCSQCQPKIYILEAFLNKPIPFASEVLEAYGDSSEASSSRQSLNKSGVQTQSNEGNNSEVRQQQSSAPPEAQPVSVPHPVPFQEAVPQPVAQRNRITMNSQFDHLKVQIQIFEITRISKYSNFNSFSLLNNSYNECIFNFVFLALSGFYFDSKVFLIKCSGCDFEADPKQIFRRPENSSLARKIRKEWRCALDKLCDFNMHGPNCFWTLQLKYTLQNSSGEVSNRGENNSFEDVNAQIDFCSNLMLSLRNPEDLAPSERPRELDLVPRPEYIDDMLTINELVIYLLRLKSYPEFLQNPEVKIFFLKHEQIPNIKFLYLMPQPIHVPNTERRPLTMSDAQAIIRVVDFKRDNPSDAKQKEAAEHRSAWARWQSFLKVEAFKQKTDGLRLAFYLSLCGIFVSSIEDSSQKARAAREANSAKGLLSRAPEVRLTCTFCIRSHTLRISLENDVEYVYLHIQRRHDFRSPTCPRTLGSLADDEPFKANQKSEILAKILDSTKLKLSNCLTPPGMFRKLYHNDKNAILAKSTKNQPRKPDVIQETMELLIELTPETNQMEVTTVLVEDCSEQNIDFGPQRSPDLLSEPVDLSILDINCALYDKEDSQFIPELEETIAKKEHSDLLTVLLGDKQPEVNYVNVVHREESFYKPDTELNTGKHILICIWPHSAIQELNPIQMAAAGFYLALDVHQPQQIDRVKCYMCGIVVIGWTASDRSMDKHKQIAPDCPFVLRLFGREHIFNSKLDSATFNRLPPVLKRVNPLNLTSGRSIEPRHQRARRDLSSVRYIMEELVIPSMIIELLIERQLASEGNDFENFQDLVDFASTVLERKPTHMSVADYLEMLRQERVPQSSTQLPRRDRSPDSAVAGTIVTTFSTSWNRVLNPGDN